jgi:hypothetical protein
MFVLFIMGPLELKIMPKSDTESFICWWPLDCYIKNITYSRSKLYWGDLFAKIILEIYIIKV